MDVQDRFSVISDAARRVFVSKVRDGYAKADDRYSEADGSNGHTYGTDLYHMTWNGLATSSELAEMGFEVVVENGRKRLLFGTAAIACHKIAAFVPPNILLDVEAAPVVSLRRAKQLGLPFPGREDEFEFDPTCTLVLAHYGNPEDGCLGVYLQAPATGDAKDGVWAAAQNLWLPGDDAQGPDGSKKPTVKVPAEVIQPAVVRRKKRDQA